MKFVSTLILATFWFSAFAQQLDQKWLEGFKFRNVGPAGMSGRITAIDVVIDDPKHIYIGSASGGVWESNDGGVTWQPIFDDQPSLAIGAIKINQRNPSEIWVGTGEGNPRNSQNSGKGIFRTIDGGRTWKQMGLENTHTIHRILIDPHNPSTVYAGAHGLAWGATPDRGLYKSTDSGATWQKILYSNDRSGIADLVMDPKNPNKLIAALWEYGRTPWDFYSGGKGSGLYITYDGGEHWKKLSSEEGLPKGDIGRIGLAIAPSSPNIVYALIESKENGLYKSTDGGERWNLVTTKNIGNRPFYYHEIYVDPQNENRLWNLYSYVSKSEDGGRTFETILDYGKGVHPDHHAFWIHPDDPDFIIDGNDGGLNISRDRGRNWYFAENIPVGQFYHLNVDHEYPYNLYGGMQDNGSWVGPAFVLKSGGIRNADWRELYFGDGFDVLPKLSDTRYGWAMSQGGYLAYYDRETGYNQFVRPVHPEGEKLRFNWNAGIAAVPGRSCSIYYGSQYVHRSDDCGQSWKIISPDLTTNDTAKQKQHLSGGLTIDATSAENHTTILVISPSPKDTNVIWVGTDDGNVQLTRNGGRTWTNLISKMPGAPSGAWIPQIEVSPHTAGEAFVVINNYRKNDWKPYLYYTVNYGETWTLLTKEKDVTSFVHAVAQDPINPSLLFLGTENGLYVSLNKGTTWTRFPAKVFPFVPTTDLKIHPVDHSLAIATFGRSLWVLDNLHPLRERITFPGNADKPFVLYPSPPTYQAAYRSVDGTRFTADAAFKGDNRSRNARFPIYVKPAVKDTTAVQKHAVKKSGIKKNETALTTDTLNADSTKQKKVTAEKDLLKLYVLNAKGDTIRYISQKLKEGWNAVEWDTKAKGVRFPSRHEPAKDADDPSGVFVVPGEYKVTGMYNGHKDSVQVEVRYDPRISVPLADVEKRNAIINDFYKDVDLAQRAFKALQDVKKDMKTIEAVMVNAPDTLQNEIKEAQKEIMKKVAALELKFMQPEDVKGITTSIDLANYLSSSSAYLNSNPGPAGPNANDQLKITRAEITKVVAEVNNFLETDWQAFKNKVTNISWPLFRKIEKLN